MLKKTFLLFSVLFCSVTFVFAHSWGLHIQESVMATCIGTTYETNNLEYTADLELACPNTMLFMDIEAVVADTTINKWFYSFLAYNSFDSKVLYKCFSESNLEFNLGGTVNICHYDTFNLGIPFKATQIQLNGAAKLEYNFNRFSVYVQTRVPLLGMSISKHAKPSPISIFSNSNLFKEIGYNTSIGLNLRLGKNK